MMTSWTRNSGGELLPLTHVPTTCTDGPWRTTVSAGHARRQLLKSPSYGPFEDHHRTDDYYNRYLQLSQNVAYQYPNAGPPRERQGRIGGHWRHIKEVLGHGGSRVVFVDGLVRIYDEDQMSARLYARRGGNRLSTPLCTASRASSAEGYNGLTDQDSLQRYMHSAPTDPRIPPLKASNNPARNMPNSPTKYKGFYTLKY